MGAVWQVQEAKNRFSALIDQALTQGPQVITRHGRAVVHVVAADPAMDRAQADGFAQYLLNAPRLDGLELPVRRNQKAALTLGG